MKKIICSKRGEMYIEVVITLILLTAFLVMSISVFQAISLKNTVDRMADELLETAAYTGGFGEEFDNKVTELQNKHFYFEVSYSAEAWFNQALERVQLGDTLYVSLTFDTNIAGFGSVVPLELTVHRSGASEKYWK